MNLLHPSESAERVFLLEAINVGAASGTAAVLQHQALPHQIDMREVLAVAGFAEPCRS